MKHAVARLGGVAVGARLGANLAIGDGHTLFSLPISLVGHWGYPRFSLYGGAGYTPYASHRIGMDPATELHGFHVIGGGRVVLKASRSWRMSSSIDVFQHYFQGAVATSATTAIGLHL